MNVKFLKGSQAEFENVAGRYKPGAFYLVINEDKANKDEYTKPSRLYYGVDENNCVPVNQGINVIDTVGNLPTPSKLTAGEFYYAEKENILCINNGNNWVQTNTDTILSKENSRVVVREHPDKKNTVIIENKIQDSAGNSTV